MGYGHGCADVGGCEYATGASYPLQRDAGVMRCAAHLVGSDMGRRLEDDRIARLGMHTHGDLVRHRPGGNVHCGFLAEEVGDHALESVHGWIVVVHIIANDRVRDRVAHFVGWLGDGVAS